MLTAKNISVTLGKKPILNNVDFSANAGEITAIVGPNGSGKTTLLRAITADLEFSGSVHLNGHDTRQMKAYELAAIRAVLPQSTSLAFPFNVLEVVRLGLTTGGEAQRENLPMQALARVGLTGFEAKYYQELSGGEQQRVQLARVLAQVWEPVIQGAPRWLFLDEPVASLDIGHQLMVMGLAKTYADAGGGVIAVMHDLNLTAMFANRVALIDRGEMVAQGRPAEVMREKTLSDAYGCHLRINTTPPDGEVFLLPHVATI
ncbi:MAG TPA: heme ABC transporter ATP-binding protein [Rhodobacteraceae bacterium]|jgi:iron complex transport system ATP-binding protein|nr:heme ABC transporter ATP-binding protein [Paracoccaceae bacterium]